MNAEDLKEESLRDYAITWRQNTLVRKESALYSPAPRQKPEPRGAQIEALYYLRQAREEGGRQGTGRCSYRGGKDFI